MKLIHRFGYYFGGFAIGMVLLFFFLNGKNVSCSYGPEARTLKDINRKRLVISKVAESFMSTEQIDTAQVNYIMHKGDVLFSESEPRKIPCGIYRIEGLLKDNEAVLTIQNCEKIATLQSIEFIN